MRRKKVGRPKMGATVHLSVHITPAQYRKVIAYSLANNQPVTAVMREIIDVWSNKQRRNLDVPE